MTTLDAKKEKRSFFSIYKPGQGKWVRWGTVASLGIIFAFGAYWLSEQELADRDVIVRASVAVVWLLLGGLVTFWAVNSPKLAEFMIMTESEMRKVAWPSRRETISSTKVVILLTVLLGLLLFVVDVGFSKFFIWMGIA